MGRTQEILKLVEGPKVLDVGYVGQSLTKDSPKWLHDNLLRQGLEVWGIDISTKDVEEDIKSGYANLYAMSAEDFMLPVKFNSIIAGELIEHLNNPGLFLQKAYEHLEIGGKLIITTPNPFALLNIFYALYKYPRTCQNLEHTMWFCPQTIRTLFSRYNFNEKAFQLIEDYEPNKDSKPYSIFILLIKVIGFMVPKFFRRNSMIFVLEKLSAGAG